jgi:hypothetical protein
VTDYCLYRLFEIWGDGKILEIIFSPGRISWLNFFYYDTGSISCISELVLSVDVVFKSLWSRMRFVVEVITVGGGLPGFLEASCLLPPASVVRSLLQ